MDRYVTSGTQRYGIGMSNLQEGLDAVGGGRYVGEALDAAQGRNPKETPMHCGASLLDESKGRWFPCSEVATDSHYLPDTGASILFCPNHYAAFTPLLFDPKRHRPR
jgi:hypothetical protein